MTCMYKFKKGAGDIKQFFNNYFHQFVPTILTPFISLLFRYLKRKQNIATNIKTCTKQFNIFFFITQSKMLQVVAHHIKKCVVRPLNE